LQILQHFPEGNQALAPAILDVKGLQKAAAKFRLHFLNGRGRGAGKGDAASGAAVMAPGSA
jgi:hypothetical protein